RCCNELVMQMATRGAIMKGSILTFGIVGALAITLSSTTSFAQASYAGNSNMNASSSLLMLVKGGHGGRGGGGAGGGRRGGRGRPRGGGGGGGGGGRGGGMGGSFGGGSFGSGSFGGGHVSSGGGRIGAFGFQGGPVGHGSRMVGMGRIEGGHGFHGHHRNRHHIRFFNGGYGGDYGCWWSQRYRPWVCPYYLPDLTPRARMASSAWAAYRWVRVRIGADAP